MTFKEFQKMNRAREGVIHYLIGGEAWTPADWCLAIAGEVGELANILKKIKRHDCPLDSVRDKIKKEVADIITYADHLMTCVEGDTEEELQKKFDEITQRWVKRAEERGFQSCANALAQGRFSDAQSYLDPHGPYCPDTCGGGIFCGFVRGHDGPHDYSRSW
jgi:NTP pyrophosphatase (non-canonical NTP hydrolase)